MTAAASRPPRIVLIHALLESVGPAHGAFASDWPDAIVHDLVHTALLDGAIEAIPEPAEIENTLCLLLQLALRGSPPERPTDGIVFTCSAFGAAIDRVRAKCDAPMVHPTEAAIEAALAHGERVTAIVSTAAAVDGIVSDFARYAPKLRQRSELDVRVADGALEALRRGDREAHDEAMLRQVARAGSADVVLFSQFSTAHVAERAGGCTTSPVVTVPHAAVQALRKRIAASRPSR